MGNQRKAEQALAMIAALQTILDKLPENSMGEEGSSQGDNGLPNIKDPTHQLFVGPLDQHSLAGLFTSIRIIHTIHKAAPAA